MDKNELRKQYLETEKKFEKAKMKRAVKTVLFFAALYFLLIVTIEKTRGLELLGAFLAALFLGGVHLLINSAVFYHLFSVNEAEKKCLDEMKKRIDTSELDKDFVY